MRVAEIDPSGHVVLGCGRCGEVLVLLGLQEDWTTDGRGVFACGGCGEELTLADRLGEDEGANR